MKAVRDSGAGQFVTSSWLYSDELNPATQQVFNRVVTDGAWVPSL